MNTPTIPSAAHYEWVALKRRILRRAVRVVDVLQILFFDTVVILFWQAVLALTKHFATPGSVFFGKVRALSDGACLIAYMVWVVFDLKEFFEQSYLRRE
ncbi:MAG: hypothetical protein ABR861_15080 [Terriglobales bacterium]